MKTSLCPRRKLLLDCLLEERLILALLFFEYISTEKKKAEVALSSNLIEFSLYSLVNDTRSRAMNDSIPVLG